jgi:hypothetical protein
MRRQAGDIVAIESDAARRRRQSAGDGVEQRGLAGPIRSDNGAALALRYGEADAIDRAKSVERHDDIGKREDRIGHSYFR